MGDHECTHRQDRRTNRPRRSCHSAGPVSLDDLHAFRIDLKTLWEALIAEGRAVGVGMRAEFLERS
jgi:hypothetical protein